MNDERGALVLVAAVLLAVSGFYVWTAASSNRPIRFERQTEVYDLYNQLVDGLLKGQLSLGMEPPRQLLELPNPYDPGANRVFRGPVHDVSLFEGRFYLYFGITPAVTLLLPFRIITGGIRMSIRLAVVLFALGGLLGQIGALRYLRRLRFRAMTPYVLPLAVLPFALSGFVPFVLRRPAMYELAICSGYCFFFGGIYLFMKGFLSESGARPRFALRSVGLGSLFFGLAIGARPTYAVAAVVLFSLCGWRVLSVPEHRIERFAALFIPAGLVMSLLLLYNNLRFHQLFEFGQQYQLAGFDPTQHDGFISPRFFLTNAFAYFLCPPVIDRIFPFFHFPAAPTTGLPTGHLGLEPITGVIPSVPFILLNLTLPFMLRAAGAESTVRVARIAGVFILMGACVSAFLCCFAGGTERYLVDFVPSFVFASFLLWIGFNLTLKPSYAKTALNAVVSLLLAFGILLNLGISLTGHSNTLNRHAYDAIRSCFSWIER